MDYNEKRDTADRNLCDILCSIVLFCITILLLCHVVTWSQIGTSFTALILYLYRGLEEAARERRKKLAKPK